MYQHLAAALAATFAVAATAAAAPADHARPGTAPVFSPAITAQGFKAFDQAISSDYMDGRKPGTVGAERATAWIVQQMKAIGLTAGNHGQWFQQVPTVAITLQNAAATPLVIHEGGASHTFKYGTDWVANTLQDQPKVTLKAADLVFVGYGIDAPEWHWNDYANLDVKGKTVVILVNDPGYATGDPRLFKGKTMTYYGRWTYKYEEAARQGAAAALIVHSTGAAGYPWKVVQGSWSGTQLSLPVSEDPGPRLPVAGWITTAVAQQIFAKAGFDFDHLKAAAAKRGFKAVPLKATASLTLDSTIGHGSANNVLGLIRGTEHPDQVIVYSAHWDHLGANDTLKGDRIYNGAIDNGTGIAALLEIAKAFKAQHPAPKRSVLFLADTLEESGLLGSLYYTKHPVFPMDQTVADINMDAMDVIGPTRNLQIIGSGQSQLEDSLKSVLKQQGRYASSDATPQNGFYFRSDHFSFAKAGVPALMTQTGNDLAKGGVAAGQKRLDDYTAHRYHTPYDNFDAQWDFTGVAADAQALYEVGRQLADGNTWPAWYPASEFRARRKAQMEAK